MVVLSVPEAEEGHLAAPAVVMETKPTDGADASTRTSSSRGTLHNKRWILETSCC